MKKILLSISFLTTAVTFAQTPDLVWAKTSGSSTFDLMRSITTDNTGNTITVGDFTGTADLDPSYLTRRLKGLLFSVNELYCPLMNNL